MWSDISQKMFCKLNFWFDNIVTLHLWLVFTNFATRSYQCSLFNFTPVTFRTLRHSWEQTLSYRFIHLSIVSIVQAAKIWSLFSSYFWQVCGCVCVSQLHKSRLGRLIVEVSRSHTIGHTHTYSLSHPNTPSTTPLKVWSARPRGRYLCNTKSTKKNNHALSGIPIHNHSNRAAAGPYLKRTVNRTYCCYSLHHFHSVSVFDTCDVWCFVL